MSWLTPDLRCSIQRSTSSAVACWMACFCCPAGHSALLGATRGDGEADRDDGGADGCAGLDRVRGDHWNSSWCGPRSKTVWSSAPPAGTRRAPAWYPSGIGAVDAQRRGRTVAGGHQGARPADGGRLGRSRPAGPGGSRRRWRPPRAAGERRRAHRRALGRAPPGVGGQDPAGLRGPAPQGAGREAVQTSPQGYALHLPPDEVDSLRFEEQVDPGPRAADPRRGRPGGVPAGPGAGPVARGGLRRPGELGAGAPRPGALAELRLEAEELRVDALLRAGRHREVLAEAQTWSARRRCVSTAGCCWRARSTSPGSRARRCARSTSSGGCWPGELGHRPGPEVVALEQSILRQDPSLAGG